MSQVIPPPTLVEFLKHVLPEDGWKCWVALKKDEKPQQGHTQSPEELAAILLQVSAAGYNAYFACASYKTNASRKAENAHAARSFWCDLDAGTGKPYADAEAALDALDAFTDKIGLPRATVVYSGNGIHAYWVLDRILDAETWTTTAKLFKTLTKHHELHADPSRTADITSILRPLGTYNWKDPSNPKLVICEELEPITSAESFISIIKNAAAMLPSASIPDSVDLNKAAANIYTNHDPFYASIAVDHCAQLRRFRDTKGVISEPIWYACLGVLGHCADGDDMAQLWSSGHRTYSKEETSKKINQARSAAGPTTCEHFKTLEEPAKSACLGCPFSVKSPIVLGRSTQTTLEKLNVHYAWIKKIKKIWRFEFTDFIDVRDFRNELANQYIIKGEDVIPAAVFWLQSPGRRQHNNVVYEPGSPAITQQDEINLWRGWGCEPVAGDVKPFFDLLNHLISGDQDKIAYLMRWLAYPIQHPGCKLMVVVVIWSRLQGVGKSLLAEIMAGIYGDNSATITTEELEDKFNAWLRGKQFIVGEEIAGADKRKFADTLKQLITGSKILINEKFQPRIELRNTVNFLFLSNLAVPVYVEEADRRYFVIHAREERQSEEFYKSVWHWYKNGGKAALLYHLKHQVDLASFNPHAPAPRTSDKDSVIELGRSSVERFLLELKDGGDEGRPLRLGEELAQLANTNITAIARSLSQLGAPPSRRPYINGVRLKSHYAVADYEKWKNATTEQWGEQIQKQLRCNLQTLNNHAFRIVG